VHNWIAWPQKAAPAVPTRVEAAVDVKFEGMILESEPILVSAASPRIIPVERKKSWRDYAIPAARLAWLGGFLLFFLRILIATSKLMLQSRRFALVTDPQTLAILDEARRRMRIRRGVSILSAPNLTTPALMGLIRPRILLPAKVIAEFRPSELRLIFLHELAHLRRRDVAVNWLITVLNMLHWFNPLLWLAFARLRAERELACDELVLAASEVQERREYGNTMIKLLQAYCGGAALPGVVGILEGQAPLRRRITMIAQFERKQSRTWIAVLTALILAMVCLTDAAVGQQRVGGPRQGVGGPNNPAAAQQGGPFGAEGAPAPQGPAPRFADVQQDRTAEAANEKTRAALRKVVSDVKFEQVAIGDAIDYLRDVTQLNIYVDWKATEGTGIPRDAQISLRLKNVPAGEVLRLALRETSPELHYQIESGIVVISPSPQQPVAVIKAYNVEDLTRQSDAQFIRSRETLEERLKAATEEAQREQFRAQIANVEIAAEERHTQRMQELVALIQNTVSPYVNTGMAVRSFDSKLIITADEAGHQEVANVLLMLRDRGEGAGEGQKSSKGGGGSIGQ